MTNPPERAVGGVQLVGEKPKSDIHGPEAPADREVIEIYAPRRTALFLEPTVEPDPIMVYANAGGKYYHSAECKYRKDSTPECTLTQAIDGGYAQCPDCSAPSPY